MQWLRDIFFIKYIDYDLNTTYIYYVSGALTANKDDLIRFADNTVWECQIDATDVSADNPIINPLSVNWLKILNDSIGIWERKNYNCQKMSFEYLLNRYFNPTSDPNKIYINNNATAQINFLVGILSCNTSVVGDSLYYGTPNINQFYVGDYVYGLYGSDFTVYIKTAQLAAIDADAVKAKAIMSRVIDRFNCVGRLYDIQTY